VKRLKVYIAGPISRGDMLQNIRQFDDAFLHLLRLGFAPFNPGTSVYLGSSRPSSEPGGPVVAEANSKASGVTHEQWMAVDLAWLECADALVRLPGESVGADLEVEHAKKCGIPVFDGIAELVMGCNK
jgi:hypothetical protein